MASGQEDQKQVVLDTFRRFDTNGDGRISRQELSGIFRLLKAKDTRWDDDSIDALMNAADTNKDGNIQYEEFVDWVMQARSRKNSEAGENADAVAGNEGPISVNYRVFLPERFQVDISQRYALDKLTLGEGGYGKVFIARDREFESRRVAVKKVTKTSSRTIPDALRNEIKVMKELDHPSICKLLGTFDQGRSMYFIMELCEGGEVFDRIIANGHISEALSADIISQVSSALAYAHGRGIAHRDIKPENVVFCSKDANDSRVKLIDWGLAFTFLGTPMTSAVGSFRYAAPEVITSENRKEYTAACDLWSLGVLTYVMLSGKPPFWGSQSQHLWNARAERYPMKGAPWDKLNPDAKDFIKILLKADPAKRPTASNLMEHSWLTTRSAQTALIEDSEQVLKNLQGFSGASTFERMCISAVARQLDHHHLKDIHAIFRSMDANGDGVLSLREVSDGFRRIHGPESDEYKQVAELYAKLDFDGSKCIDYTEFCAAALGQKAHMQDEVTWAAFKTFDTNDSGYIERAELQQTLDLADMKDVWTGEVCQKVSQELLEAFDNDKDGRISFEDWKGIMQRCWDRQAGGDEGGETLGQTSGGLSAYELLQQVSELPTAPQTKAD
mmetsp:Transcript_32604/g.75764  ORF Transcript_32604/g.75764 Transcript_32604/m.75764 type:complete len:615 (+) Transcript_32604:92-1936(+)